MFDKFAVIMVTLALSVPLSDEINLCQSHVCIALLVRVIPMVAWPQSPELFEWMMVIIISAGDHVCLVEFMISRTCCRRCNKMIVWQILDGATVSSHIPLESSCKKLVSNSFQKQLRKIT